jgi:hypothetical protein
MKPTGKHILLISYVFPPYPGIGGRRWARHAQQMSKLGYTVHVICAANPFSNTSLWFDHVKNDPNIIRHTLPAKYPAVLLKTRLNVFQKLSYKFWMGILPVLTKRNYFDRTIFWRRILLNKAREIITRNNITQVICSGGPFGAMYYSTLLKKEFPQIFLLNDLRDPWTWGPNWGFPGLSDQRMKVEKEMEKLVMRDSDVISVPGDALKEELSHRYPDYSQKIKVLPHFFDKNEIDSSPKTKSNKVRLLFYGNIYMDSRPYIEILAKFIGEHSEKFSLDVYTEDHSAKKIFEEAKAKDINFHRSIPPKELFKEFKTHDYVVLLQPAYAKDAITTKFYEIIYSRTPIIIFSETGAAASFVVKNDLGYHADKNGMTALLDRIAKDPEMKSYNSAFDINAFTLENITQSLVTILEKGIEKS